MRPSMHSVSPSGWPSGQSPAQGFLSSPAMESPSQIGHSHTSPESPCYDPQPTFYEVVKILQSFVSAGLNHRQISYLCKPTNFNKLGIVANTDVNVTQSAWGFVYQKLPGSKSRKLSRGPSMRYPSGVSSLKSNRSQWSASTDLSTSTAESYTLGFGNPFDGQHQVPGWHTVSGEMDAMIATDAIVHGNITTAAFVPPNFEQPQRQDFHQSTTTSGFASVYQPHTLEDNSALSSVANANASYAIPNCARYYSAGGNTTQDNRPSAAATDSNYQTSGETALRKDHIKYPCPEPDCPKRFVRAVELGKHLQGDHDRNDIYVCQHDQICKKQTYRHATWARHHSKDHNSCKKGDSCVQSTNDRKKRYWGCSICIHLSRDVSSHADHHQSHFKDGMTQPHDIKYSTMVLSLLSQEATKGRWEALCVAMNIQTWNCDYGWQPAQFEEIRLALEYGKYQGSDISDPLVADRLLNEVVVLTAGKRKRPASGIPNFSNVPNPEDSWLDVNPPGFTSFLDITDAEFTESY